MKRFDVLVAVIILAVIGAVVMANEDSCYVLKDVVTKQPTDSTPGEFKRVVDHAIPKIEVALNLKPFTAKVCPGDTALLRATIAQLYYIVGIPKAKLDSVANANVRVK